LPGHTSSSFRVNNQYLGERKSASDNLSASTASHCGKPNLSASRFSAKHLPISGVQLVTVGNGCLRGENGSLYPFTMCIHILHRREMAYNSWTERVVVRLGTGQCGFGRAPLAVVEQTNVLPAESNSLPVR
jgi:hypothetical protein